MKNWKLMAVVSNSPILLDRLKNYENTIDLPEKFVLEILKLSTEKYSICSDGFLRTRASNYSFDIKVNEELSAITAFKRFGGDAIFEAVDKGSYKIKE